MNVKNHCIGRKHLSVVKCRRQNFFEKKVALYGSSAYKRSIKKKGEMIL